MFRGKYGLSGLILVALGLALTTVATSAYDEGTTSTFWEDRRKAQQVKKTTSPERKTTAPKTAAPKASSAPRRSTVRRAVVETAPSGVPVEGETRFIGNEIIVRFALSARQSTMNRLIARLRLAHQGAQTFKLAGVTMHRYRISDGADVSEIIKQLEASASVVTAQPNYLYQPAQSAAPKPGQYALARLAVAPISGTVTGAGVKLAIVDSIVDVAHPELSGATIEMHNVSDAPDAAPDAHGTGLAGIAVAGGTLSGIAPQAEILAIAAFAQSDDGQTLGNSWTIASALDVAADNAAQIINMSFAGPRDPLLERSVAGAGKRGMILIAAAGNDGPGAAALYPGAYAQTVGVTAIDDADAIYGKANRGDYVDVAAPGVNILTAAPGGAYDFVSGTSLASAHISALAALLLSADPGLTQQKLAELLASTSVDLGDTGRDSVFGNGVPSAAKALEQLGQ